MDKSKLLKIAELFESQAVLLLKEARRLRAMAENKQIRTTEHDTSLSVH
jgi:hypothetical protein